MYLTDIAGGLAVGVVSILVTALLLRRIDPKIARRADRAAD
ncbi:MULTISPECIES: hypothetical protein [unclassified Frankia]